ALEQWREEAHTARTRRYHERRFADKLAVVTGGAQGIGRAFAQRLVAEGARVVVADVADAPATELAELLPGVSFVHCDVTDETDVDALAREVQRQGGADVLISCAGGAIVPRKPFWQTSPDDWDFVVNLNLKHQWLVAKALVPPMIERGHGKIVNMASLAGIRGAAGIVAYASAKGGVVTLTKVMALELGPYNINVNGLAPGFTLVEHSKSFHRDAVQMSLTIGERYVQNQMIRRVGVPTDVAAAGLFLASADADHITGQILHVDGGLRVIPLDPEQGAG